jgi:hypothetical protein
MRLKECAIKVEFLTESGKQFQQDLLRYPAPLFGVVPPRERGFDREDSECTLVPESFESVVVHSEIQSQWSLYHDLAITEGSGAKDFRAIVLSECTVASDDLFYLL